MSNDEEIIKEQGTIVKNLYHKWEVFYSWLEEKEGELLKPEDIRKFVSKLDERYPTIIPRRFYD